MEEYTMSKIDKELKKEETIAKSLATIIEARESVESLVKQYDEWIDQAFELGETEYSDQLIADQVELEEFSRNLSFVEVRIRESAVSARAFGKLKCLPNAMKCCKDLSSGLNLPKIGKDMVAFRKSLDNARASLKDLRSEMSADDKFSKLVLNEKLGRKIDSKTAQAIEQKKLAREGRLAQKVSNNSVAPVASGIGADVSAGIDAITAMIDEENKKN